MTARYFCRDEGRRAATRSSGYNGIDFLEVLDHPGPEHLRQRFLAVHLLKLAPRGPRQLTAANVRIEGGARVSAVPILWTLPLPVALRSGDLPTEEKEFLSDHLKDAPDKRNIQIVRTAVTGDFSKYRLRLVDSSDPEKPIEGFDRRLSEVDFSFKVDCPSDFDCRTDPVCPPRELAEPELSYLAKDYASFRRLMLDRMSAIVPRWNERNPADLGIALVELFAYVGDQLSYYQDAVATEAYLGTARKRLSVRRHARMVDYAMHEGSNARAFVVFDVDSAAEGTTLSDVKILTGNGSDEAVLSAGRLQEALAAGATVFETMHDVTLYEAHNEILFYTWSDKECCLPAGATSATLVGPLPDLRPMKEGKGGDLLLFEERLGPKTGVAADADPRHRHVVRLTKVEAGWDLIPVDEDGNMAPVPVVEIEWDPADALPLPLCLSTITDNVHGARLIQNVSVARGNVVLADHGRTVREDLGEATADQPFRPVLDQGPLTYAAPLPADFEKKPAAALQAGSPRDARPALYLLSGEPQDRKTWRPQPDLLASDRFARELVVEMEEDGRAHLRFGDDQSGRAPDAGTSFEAWYRVGNGPAGNLGAEVLRHVFSKTSLSGIRTVRNPLPATGGREPEDLEEVRQFAPQAFRIQQRAVTEEDYAEVAQRHPEVQRAAATFRWTGSWITVFLTIDRRHGLPVDAMFERRLREHMGFYRMAGHDLEIDAPLFVPLDVALRVCVRRGYLRSQVKAELLARLGSSVLPDGRRGLFHPDDWTFGQPVYLSRLYAVATEVEGVESVEIVRFQRRGRRAQGEIEAGVLPLGRLEIAQLDNNPSFPENGRLELLMGGGR